MKRVVVVIVVTMVAVIAVSLFAYQSYDLAQHTPKLCTTCHLMQTAYDTWSHSSHKDIDCHSCHRASIAEQNRYVLNMLIRRPKEVPPRHGRVIVPRTVCLECHWEGKAGITKVNASPGHAEHAFVQNIQCTSCHAQELHRFMPDSKVCAKCHSQTVKVAGMDTHDCQICHAWKGQPGSKSRDLMPTRETCLDCHGSMKPALFPASAPMRFACATCHQPHEKAKPQQKDCLKCHAAVARQGKHRTHLTDADLGCNDCHRPHTWKITESQAKVDCARCHEYRAPASFLADAAAPFPLTAHAATADFQTEKE